MIYNSELVTQTYYFSLHVVCKPSPGSGMKKMILQRICKRESALWVEGQKIRERHGGCGVLWKMITENSLGGSILCITILILQILILDVNEQ